MDDGKQKAHGNHWVDDGDEWLSLAQRAEMRERANVLRSRAARRDRADDAPAPGDHYSKKTGHLARGLAAKFDATRRARFELSGEPDSSDSVDGAGQFDPLTGHCNARANRKDARASLKANGSDEATSIDGEPVATRSDELSMVEKVTKPRAKRDKQMTRPNIARRKLGGNQR